MLAHVSAARRVEKRGSGAGLELEKAEGGAKEGEAAVGHGVKKLLGVVRP
jgi:hypothetical protein